MLSVKDFGFRLGKEDGFVFIIQICIQHHPGTVPNKNTRIKIPMKTSFTKGTVVLLTTVLWVRILIGSSFNWVSGFRSWKAAMGFKKKRKHL